MWFERRGCDFEEVDLKVKDVPALDATSIRTYEDAVARADYSDAMFEPVKQFVAADEIAMAAPMWNLMFPARLMSYLEVCCTQGLSFDVTETGAYVSLVAAKRLTLISTSGGPWPKAPDDHAVGFVETLNRYFWHIPQVDTIVADGLDIYGCDVDEALASTLQAAF